MPEIEAIGAYSSRSILTLGFEKQFKDTRGMIVRLLY